MHLDPPRPERRDAGRGLRYVALGDSYTIGTSVRPEDRWPNQLVAALDRRAQAPPAAPRAAPPPTPAATRLAGDQAPQLELVANLAVNGYTSEDVLTAELRVLERLDPEYVSLLIGTNDVIQGIPPERYRSNLVRIVEEVEARVGAAHILGVTTPDYTVTPHGAEYGDPAMRAAQIREYNAIFGDVLGGLEIDVVDIHDLSLRAADDRSLLAGDGLHPSGRQYGLWVERIEPVVRELFAAVSAAGAREADTA